MQCRGDQGRRIVVERSVEIPHRARGMLESRRAQLRAVPACESGQKHGVEIDQVEPSPVVRDDVFGFQVAVRPVVRRERRGHAVECGGKSPQPRRVARLGGCGDRFVKRHAFDPVAQHHIHPDAACGRGVDEKLLRQQLLAVDFRQMARMVHVTAQRADAAFAADAEYDGAVACRVTYAPLSVAAHLDLAQRPGEAVRIGQRGQVLAQCEHGFY